MNEIRIKDVRNIPHNSDQNNLSHLINDPGLSNLVILYGYYLYNI